MRCYAIVGTNAYGLYNNYGKMLNSKKYVKECTTRNFNKIENALMWIEKTYLKKQENPDASYKQVVSFNWLTYRKNIRETPSLNFD